MKKHKVDDEELAGQTGVDRVTINRLKRGVHLPSWPTMKHIAEVTKRQVMPNDFLEIS
jgi:transcriptional regulator with XRE-family HTH domain